jgi:hypothetical protein
MQAIDDFRPLVSVQFGLASKLDSPSLGPNPTVPISCPNEASLKFRQATQDGDNEPQKMNFPGVPEFMTRYQARAQQEGVDPLGYYIAPWGYAQLQVLQHAVVATKSLDDDKLADYIRKSTFKTLVGDVTFGTQGEWAESRVLQVQFQHIKGTDLGQFKDLSTQVVITPAQYKSGDVIYPYEKAK